MFGGKRFAWRGGPRLGTYDGQPALPSAEDVKAQKLGLKLRKQFRKKDYNGAAKTCEEMLKLQPKNAGHYYNLACCRARQGKKREALLALQHAIKNGWDDAEHMQKDPDLASLRRDPNFIRLLQYVKQQGKRR
jgi:tetratricopeptide (TPR) repeat protein